MDVEQREQNELLVPDEDGSQELQVHEASEEDAISVVSSTGIGLRPVPADTEVDLSQARKKIPLDSIAALGTVISSLPESMRTVTQELVTLAAGNLVQLTDASGNALNLSNLYQAKDGTGSIGSYRNAEGNLAQARIHAVESQTLTSTVTLPYDPTSLFTAIQLAEISAKLDRLQETQDRMFRYMQQKDVAEVRGKLELLEGISNDCRFNWDNDTFKQGKYVVASNIRKESLERIKFLQSQIGENTRNTGLTLLRKGAREKLDGMVADLREYQVALYTYSYAYFLEVMLGGNYRSDFLKNVEEDIHDHAVRYRELYTECYDVVEHLSGTSVQSMVAKGISGAEEGLGNVIRATPLGATQIDEALISAGQDTRSADEEETSKLLGSLRELKNVETDQFIEGIDLMDELCNSSTVLIVDAESLYVLPASETGSASNTLPASEPGGVPYIPSASMDKDAIHVPSSSKNRDEGGTEKAR